jgi:hypothetical protein
VTSTLEALQTTLAAEHAAVWMFGTLGAQTSQSRQPALYGLMTGSYAIHRARRDQLSSAVRELGVEPVAAAVAYELTNDLSTVAEVTSAALQVETDCAAVYADLVASTYGDQRRWAIRALTDAAVRELGFRGSPVNFPGMSELADR